MCHTFLNYKPTLNGQIDDVIRTCHQIKSFQYQLSVLYTDADTFGPCIAALQNIKLKAAIVVSYIKRIATFN